MELEIKPRTKLQPRSTGVVWGPTKAGKTTLLSTLPKPILFVVVDPEGASVVPADDDTYILDLSMYSSQEICTISRNKVPTLIKEGEDIPEIKSVVYDSLTTLSWAALQTAIRNKVGGGKGFTPTLESPGLAAYGARTNYITDVVRNLLRVTALKGINCWFTAHQDEPTMGPDQNPIYTTLTLSGKSINQLGIQVSEIWHLRERQGKRYIAVRNSRGRQPMGTRMFKPTADEFQLDYDPQKDMVMSDWINQWKENKLEAIPLPK